MYVTDDIVKDKPNPKPSFAQTVKGTYEVPISLLPKPCIKGDVVAVKIPEAAYQVGLERCKTNLHGRLILAKGDQPLKFVDLKTRLLDLWNMVGKWNMISLGRGFYEFVFSSIEDMRTIWATGSWNLKPGILRLSLWTPDFNLWLQRITHSQCWIKITGLPQEYWCPSIIFTIAGGIGMPISIDEATTRRSFGHFARVLVDIDLKNSVPTQMLVERDGFEFFVCIDVENMPAFYTGCQAIGHVVSKCRRSSKMVVDEVAKPMARKAQLPVVKPTSVNIVIDLDIEDVNTLGMERLMLNPEDTHSESSAEAVDKTLHNESSLDIVGKVLQNESDPDILGKALQSGSASVDSNVNLIVTEELRPVAARDMAIVGRLWGENENDKVYEEEDSFTQVLSKVFGNPKTRLVLKNYCLANKPTMVFIAEPMIGFEEVNPLFWASLKLKGFGFNDRGNMRPNIWGLCDIGLNPNLLATSTKHITSSLEVENKLIFINAVYTHNSYLHKRQLWAEIQTLMNDNQGPWCYIGDFNVVLGAHECRGPNLPPILPSAEFQLFTDARCLIHLATRGADFTWTNRRRGVAETEKSLDICIVNEDWMTVWNQISCSTLPRIASDHHPLLLCFSLASVPRPSAFKFHKMWLSHVDCQRLVAETWRVEVVGCPLFVLSQKLRLLKKELKVWNFQVFGNIHERVKTALASVAAIQEVLNSSGHDEDLLEQEHLAQNELLQALVMEEKFWQDKARLSWQNEGDRNTSFFLKTTKIRQASKALSTLRDGDNILVGQEEIDQHTLAYFTDLYATPNNAQLKIKLATSLSRNNSKLLTNNSIANFVILREFKVKQNFPKAPRIKEVVWLAPQAGWIKINTDGAAHGSPGFAGGGCIYRDSNGDYMGGFADFFGVRDSLFAELQEAIMAVEIAQQKGWMDIWLECDSVMVVEIFNGKGTIPWREGNTYADRLAAFGVSSKYQSWKSLLSERFSPERERITWEGEILDYTGGFSPERELSRLGEK
ncbi:hypothetical protein Lal_00011206 [Lupinus albus]|nr:hypothetical protein Lal_00011206 [Lupinus albus]